MTSEPFHGPADRRTWSAVAAAIAGLLLVFAGQIMHPWGEQQGSRLALTAAVVDRQSVSIDGFEHLLGRDRGVRDGVPYSDKAPGQPLLAVPFYATYRLVGGESVADLDRDGSLVALWWLTFWTAAVPASILAVLILRWVREVAPGHALGGVLLTLFGTLLLVYASLLFGHTLAAVLVFGMFLVVRRRSTSIKALVAAGALGGAAVLVEYPVVVVVAVLFAAGLLRHRAMSGWMIVGGAPFVAGLLAYNFVIAGDPFLLSYQWTAFYGPQPEAAGLFDIFAGPELTRLWHVFVSDRGLFVATPVIAVGFAGLVLLFKRGARFDALVASSAFFSLVAIQVAWGSSYAGGAGPRYLVPVMAFLAAPIAVGLGRWKRTTLLLGGISVLTMVVATLTVPQLESTFDGGLGLWISLLLDGRLTTVLPVYLLGDVGWIVFGGAVAGVAGLLWRVRHSDPSHIGLHAESAEAEYIEKRMSADLHD